MVRKSPEEAQETRRKLLESALDIMSKNSFSSVTMAQIANNVGLSKGAIYWHFKGKDDLLICLIEHYCMQMREIVFSNGKRLDSLNSLREYYLNKLVRLAESDEYQKMSLLVQREWEWPEQAGERIISIVKALLKEEEELIADLFCELQERGVVRKELSMTPNEIAEIIVSTFHGLFSLQLHGCYAVDMEKSIHFLCDAFEKEVTQDSKERDGVVDNGMV